MILESDILRAEIDPVGGGRIRSLVSKRSNKEYLFQDPRTEFNGDGYSDNDISGYCECFPTVARCTYPDGLRKGMDVGDHGLLWQGPWQVDSEENLVTVSKYIPQLECLFRRTCQLESPDCLRLDYRIRNHGREALSYVYSAHPLLNAGEYTRIQLPHEVGKAYVYLAIDTPGFTSNILVDWPPPPDTSLLNGPFRSERQSVIKLFLGRLTEGRAAIRHANVDEALIFDFDCAHLPFLGVLVSQGYYGPYEDLKGSIFVGLEPTTSMGDDLETCASGGTHAQLLPDHEAKFWIKLTLATCPDS